ncbi:SDR family oxidoreductase [Psychrobacillus sp.]|uniref:SDR family oxidoreductase n=1 Tax=Psychrobacillus sp. TaxID=1871623 RepID=UPI0028BD5DFD|nr:SDR family oxidoreductase [Psychrobacillus sp.]
MYNDLKDKVFIVTGATQGIGRAIAIRLGKEKCKVVVDYHDESNESLANEVVSAIKEIGGQAVACRGDVSEVDTVKKLVDVAVSHFGTLHGIVNNAGIQSEYSSESLPVDEWDRIMNINLRGAFLGCQETIKYLLKHNIKGSIVNISSVHQRISKPNFVHYAASKGGIKMMTETLAREYASKGIRINSVAPDAIATPMNAEFFEDPVITKEIIDKIPCGVVGNSEEIAAPVAWLLSQEASYVAGATLFVDGGMVLY